MIVMSSLFLKFFMRDVNGFILSNQIFPILSEQIELFGVEHEPLIVMDSLKTLFESIMVFSSIIHISRNSCR